jgi:hypothetical protein
MSTMRIYCERGEARLAVDVDMKNPGARKRAVKGAGKAMQRESSGRRRRTPTKFAEASHRARAWMVRLA